MGPPPADRGEDWFTATYAAHYAAIVKYGLRRLGSTDASVELAQEAFVVAWRRRAEVPDHSLPWLYGVARRLLANRRRADRNRPVHVPLLGHEEGNDQRAAEGAAAELAAVRAAMAGLSERDQEILRLIGWEELTVSEAATVLDCTRTTAAVRLHRARRRLTAAVAHSTTATSIPRPAAIPS